MVKNLEKTQSLVPKESNYKLYMLFMLIAFVFYGNSIKNGYSIDDELVTSTYTFKNKLTDKGIMGLKAIFKSRYANDGKQSYDYRPVTTYSFAVEHSIVGNSPKKANISHFVSVALYGLCGIFLFLFLQQLFKGEAKWFSMLVVVLYLIHPIHTEIVDNIKTRDELLCMLFCLSASIHAFKYFDTRKLKHLLLAITLLFLALYSRPSAKVFLGIIPLSLYFFRDFKLKTILLYGLIAFFFNFLSKLIGRLFLAGIANVRDYDYFENPLRYMDLSARIPMFFYSIVKYIGLLFFPYPLKYYYGYNDVPLVGFGSLIFFAGVVIVGLLLYVVWKGLKSKAPLSYALLFFFFGIGGVANLLFPAPGIIAERFANFASIGFAMTLAILLFRWQKWNILAAVPKEKRSLTYGLLAVVALPSVLLVFNRNKLWDSKLSLYRSDIGVLHNSTKANSLLATEYLYSAMGLQQSGNISMYKDMMSYADSAAYFFNRSVEIYPEYASCWNNLAVIQFNFYNNIDSARTLTHLALSHDSKFLEAYYNLGNCYGKYASIFGWLASGIADSSLDGTLAVSNPYVLNNVIEKSIVVPTVMKLMTLEGMSRQLANPQVPPQQVAGFVRFAQDLIGNENKILGKLNVPSYFEKIAQAPVQQRQGQLLALFAQLKLFINKKIAKRANDAQLTPASLRAAFKTKSRLYEDSTFMVFDRSYQIDPAYGKQYDAVFNFAKSVNRYDQVFLWAERFKKHFSTIPQGNVELQLGYAYAKVGKKDSSLYYYEKSVRSLQQELSDYRRKDDSAPEDQQRIKAINQQITAVEEYLRKTKSDTNSLHLGSN